LGGVKQGTVVSESPNKCFNTPHSRHSRLQGARGPQTCFRIQVYWAPSIQCSAHIFRILRAHYYYANFQCYFDELIARNARVMLLWRSARNKCLQNIALARTHLKCGRRRHSLQDHPLLIAPAFSFCLVRGLDLGFRFGV
jgi:hypothetical protein